METLTFTLSIAETNVIMGALGNMPYAQVESVIQKMREQATPQLKEQAERPKQEEPLN